MRVLAPLQEFRPLVGGAQLQYERLLPHLAARGASVTVLTRAVAGRPREEVLHGARIVRTSVAGTGAAASADYVAEAALHVARHARRLDVVHAHGALSEGAIALIGTALGLPALVKILRTGEHGDLQVLARRPGGRRRLALLVRRAHFVAITPETRAELEAHGVPGERIFDIPNGVDAAVFRPAGEEERAALRAARGLPDGPLAVVVGRLDPVKRVDLAIRALAGAPGLHLVVVGDGPDRARLEAAARDAGTAAGVTFAGAQQDVASIVRAADAYLAPSDAEGLSNALLEAMACGLPCVAAPASGVRGLLGDGRGVVVDGGEDAWAAALRAVRDDGALRARLGGAAAGHVRDRMTLEVTAGRLVAAYRTIAGAA